MLSRVPWRHRLPALRHWLGGQTLTTAIPVVLTAVLGLVALWPVVPAIAFYGYLTVVVILVLVAWFSAAGQDERASKAEKERTAAEGRQSALFEEVQKLTAAVPLAVIPASARNLSMVGTADLRRMAGDIAQRMRAMEHSFERNQRRVIPKRETWDEDVERILAQSDGRRHRWQADLQPEAVAIWLEMYGRVYGASSEDDRRHDPSYHHGYMVVERGSLAGPTPLADAATDLEDLARKLPG